MAMSQLSLIKPNTTIKHWTLCSSERKYSMIMTACSWIMLLYFSLINQNNYRIVTKTQIGSQRGRSGCSSLTCESSSALKMVSFICLYFIIPLCLLIFWKLLYITEQLSIGWASRILLLRRAWRITGRGYILLRERNVCGYEFVRN